MSENDPRMPQDNNSNDPKGNESPVNFKGLIFIGIACFLIFLAINMKSSTQGTPTSWPDFKKHVNEGEIDNSKSLELVRKQESSEETLIAYLKSDGTEETSNKIEVAVNVEFQKEELSELRNTLSVKDSEIMKAQEVALALPEGMPTSIAAAAEMSWEDIHALTRGD